MSQSMTSYGQSQLSGNWGKASCEIRSVNSRYIDITVRLKEALHALEQPIHTQIAAQLKRGKINCIIKFQEHNSNDLALDKDQLRKLINIAEQATENMKMATPINPLELLRWPGIMDTAPICLEHEKIHALLLELVDKALTEVVHTRKNEGEKMRNIILQRCQLMEEKIAKVRQLAPKILEQQREKLTQCLEKLNTQLDNNRLEQELLLLAQKMDIAEEIDRLDAHISEVRRVLDLTVPIGKRLDFLMQEMHREANTLGAKSTDLANTNASIDMKVLIEEMREQIQNIE